MLKIKKRIVNNEITIEFYDKKELLDRVTKHINTCMVCKKSSIDDKDLGEKYICADCIKILKENLPTVNKTVEKTKGSILNNVRNYEPQIKVVNLVDYKNLMNIKINDKIIETIIDLVIKGINTPKKVSKVMNYDNVDTIVAYMRTMARAGMLVAIGKNRPNSATTRIYKIHPKLVYTAVV